MVYRATGKGEVEAHLAFETAGVIKALLYNFDFDDFYGYRYRPLKEQHTKFLNEHVVPLLKDDKGQIWMQGSASRIGAHQWNQELSSARVMRVATFLASAEISAEQIQTDAIGDAEAQTHALDDPRDRGVLLWVYPKLKDTPPPPRKVPPPFYSSHFKIAMLTGVSAGLMLSASKYLAKAKLGVGPAVDVMFFVVWDTTNNVSCMYLYVGLGAGIGFNFMPPVGGTTHGPWNSFTTEKPIHVWQFGRWAEFGTIGAANQSANRFTFETPRGVNDVHLWLNTGFTIGAGASKTYGDFIRIENPRPYHGP